MKAVPRRLLVLGGGPVGVEMAQAVRRLGGEVALVEGGEHVLAREPAPLGEALGEVLRRDGIELVLGAHATAARRDGEDYVLELDDGRELRGDRLLVATGRRPRVDGIGLETVGIEADPRGVPVDAQLRAGERLWAIGDVTGIWPLTHVGKYQGRVVAANILGEPREANYEAVPRVTYTDPQAAAVGATEAPLQRDRARVGGGQDRHLHARLRRVQRLPHAAQRRRAADRRLRARPRGRRMAPAGHARHPRPRAARRAARHHPALPDLLGDLPRARSRRSAREITRREPVAAMTTERHDHRDHRRCHAARAGPARPDRRRHRRQRRHRPRNGQAARAEGADVILTARNPERLQRAALELDALSTAAFDAADLAALDRFFQSLTTPVDHVMVTAGRPYYAPLAEIDFDQARRSFDDHLFLAVRVAQHAAATMRPGGSLLFMGGTGGRKRGPGLSIIAAGTAALPALVANLAVEVAPVRVNLIAAGFVDTPLSADLLGEQLENRRDELRADAAHRARRRTGRRRRARHPRDGEHGADRRDLRHRRRPAARVGRVRQP